jgi:hypothetical protein
MKIVNKKSKLNKQMNKKIKIFKILINNNKNIK